MTRRALLALAARSHPKLTKLELVPIRATERTVWLIVRLHTNQRLTGLGEASDAFGYAGTSRANAQQMEAELRAFFQLIEGRSPLEIERFRQLGEPRARAGGLLSATAYSAIEQALWDLAAQTLRQPLHQLLGTAVRPRLPIYANINRATSPRTPQGFAATARRAVAEGFRAVKAAPFDGFPTNPAAQTQAVDQGIACLEAIRAAIGPEVKLMTDCHSFFSVARAVDVAKRLEPVNLTWYEEPVDPQLIDDTVEIRRQIRQPMAGGEVLFGVSGFVPLCRRRAVEVIMPDVKHCGGVRELTYIAAMARAEGVQVAPHNPSGPVSTAISGQICTTLANCKTLELQWGEVEWRANLLSPPEIFSQGEWAVTNRPGIGHVLDERTVRRRKM
ncbi:MAG: mandelate racemase/muconate lactonizing enzyme family protein [Bryobacteraceae bacterium]|nr:mandelate racemase/muconate lactonizing enzyme family protein [Bryobacteraceae bacterium]